MCMCGENLVSIRCLDIFSASLWNLYSTDSFQKAFLEKETGQGEGRLWAGGTKFLWCMAQIAALPSEQGRTPPSAALGWGPALARGFPLPTALLLLSTGGWRAALQRDWGLCLSDPLNLIMNELSPHLPWWHKFIYFCLPSAMVRRDFPSSPWGKHEKNKGLDFHGLMRQEKSLHW